VNTIDATGLSSDKVLRKAASEVINSTLTRPLAPMVTSVAKTGEVQSRHAPAIRR
jgi:hypothetical protein